MKNRFDTDCILAEVKPISRILALGVALFSACCSRGQVALVQEASPGWSVEAPTIDPQHYSGVTISNGLMGITSSASPFHYEPAILANAYEPNPRRGVASLINTLGLLDLDVSINGSTVRDVASHRQMLNMKRAYFATSFTVADVSFVMRARALRQLPHVALLEVTVTAKKPSAVTCDTDVLASPMLGAVQYSHPEVSEEKIPKGIKIVSAKAPGISNRYVSAVAQVFAFDPKSDYPRILPNLTGQGFTVNIAPEHPFHFALIGALASSAQNSDPELTAQQHDACADIGSLLYKYTRMYLPLNHNDLQVRGGWLSTRKSYKTSHFVERVVERKFTK
jgi:hypothetical protein